MAENRPVRITASASEPGEIWGAKMGRGPVCSRLMRASPPLESRGLTCWWDVTAAAGALQVGDELAFSLHDSALLAVLTSPSVAKRPLHAMTGVAASP